MYAQYQFRTKKEFFELVTSTRFGTVGMTIGFLPASSCMPIALFHFIVLYVM